MELVRNFTALNKSDAHLAGGKGASLGEMTKVGIPVPPGFVVLSESFEQFLKETNLVEEIDAILHKVKHDEIHTVDAASEKIRALILSREMPKDIAGEINRSFKELNTKYVAVRSSATAEDGVDHAWAGQLESYLNTTEEDLLTKVKLCWSSLFTPRAIFYRFEKRLHTTKISVAVVVQKMIESEFSGIAFSVHPVTEDKNQLIIEAGFGLGESIVSGAVTPDSYVVEKEPRNILDINISTQNKGLYRSENNSKEHGNNEWKDIPEPKASSQVLTKEQIIELSDIIIKIENHYGFPCDIEWAYENERFYIVQSRPITTLAQNFEEKEVLIGIRSEYQLLFQFSGMPFLINDNLFKNYKSLKCLFINFENHWSSYLPKAVTEKTLKEGVELYGDDVKFNAYKRGFEEYKVSSKNLFEEIIGKDEITKENCINFFDATSKLHHYYLKTEFFYIDQVYLESTKNKIIEKNLKEFDYIKNSGREYLNKVFLAENNYLIIFVGLLAKQFNVALEDLLQYKMDEIVELFDDKKVGDDTLNARRVAYVTKSFGNEIKIWIGEEANNVAQEFLKIDQEYTKELKGIVANRGKVKGKVKVMKYGYHDFHLVKELIDEMEIGDILVAETTSPELILACKKASAILTNEGGLMSHAAIISRELKIPCIVALENIVDFVKDGDVVEVDADNGIVKVIN